MGAVVPRVRLRKVAGGRNQRTRFEEQTGSPDGPIVDSTPSRMNNLTETAQVRQLGSPVGRSGFCSLAKKGGDR